ncbi:MAG: hypothetical protein IJ290_02890 [Bacteroidaceae bacterium]|nr:hypothetical protein [Bacteroidaceae bacterium]
MKRTLLLILLSFSLINVFSQTDYNGKVMVVEAKVIDKVIRKPLPANVTLMWQDSTVVANGALGNEGNFSMNLPIDSVIICKFDMMGYEPYWLTLDFRGIKPTKLKNLGKIEMVEKPLELDEVVVKASKVKMVFRGDTIIYNADAFRLSDGSMLDALIEQLPGVELKGNQILVNGRYVESLLVNGKDFFRGDPSVALQNLPAYMVNKVKVYEKEHEDAYITGTLREKPLVVDVNLKKEFSTGWVSNVEAGYGTNNRYLGRMFGLLFTDQMRLAMFGNINNTSDTRQPGSRGEWNPSWQASGVTDMKLSGIGLRWDNKEETFGVETNLRVYGEDEHTESATSATNFYDDGDVYSRSRNKERDNQLHIISDYRLYDKGKYWYFDFRAAGEYFHNDISHTNEGAVFNAKPNESYRSASLDSIFRPAYSTALLDAMTYSVQNQSMSEREQLSMQGYMYGSVKFEQTLDHIVFIVRGKRYTYEDKTFSHSMLHYGNEAGKTDDNRNQYGYSQKWENNLSAQFDYNHALNQERNFILRPKYIYSYNSNNLLGNLYRLDWYEGWSPEDRELGMLPSTRDSLNHVLDIINSSNSVSYVHHHIPSIELERVKNNDKNSHYYLLRLPLNIISEQLDYQRGHIDTLVSRLTARLEGSAEYRIVNDMKGDSVPRHEYKWTYNFSNSAPSLSYNIPYVNDANPLSIYINRNDGLKSTHRHSATFYFQQRKQQRHQLLQAGVNASLVRNAIAHYRTYDKATGVTTSWPTNINGNWQASAYYSMSSALDDAERTTFSHGTTAGYVNSVDYISVVGSTADPKSVVRNVNLRESLGFENKWEQSTVYLKANATYRYATGNREDFTTIHAIDYDYGLTLKSELPWGVNLSTDLTMYSRRGYADESMNTDDLVWNARLSKSILKGNLTFIADGFDLLGQLSNIRYSVNAQGIQETWHNVMPRYAMLHVVYRFNKQPKKK